MNQRTGRLRVKAIILVTVAVGLAIPLYVVPNLMADSFARARIEVIYLTIQPDVQYDVSRTFRVLSNDNATVNVAGVAFSVRISNSYFLPVTVSYRAPELALFIYAEEVERPGDAVSMTKLVWRTTASASISDEDNVRFTSEEELVEHVVSIPPAGLQFDFANEETTWNGIDTKGIPVNPGRYYVYAIAFGRFTLPVTVTILA